MNGTLEVDAFVGGCCRRRMRRPYPTHDHAISPWSIAGDPGIPGCPRMIVTSFSLEDKKSGVFIWVVILEKRIAGEI